MRIWVVLVAACGATPAPLIAQRGERDVVPEVTLVVVHDQSLRIVATTSSGLVVRREVQLPSEIFDVQTATDGPVVLLEDYHTMGRITDKGYEEVPEFPPGTFDSKQPPGTDALGTTMVAIEIDTAGDAWRGECHWGGIDDGPWCAQWVFAKLGSNPPITRKAPSIERSTVKLPLVSPPASPVVAIVMRSRPDHDGPLPILTCTEHGHTVEYPAVNQIADFSGMSDVVWLEREPPVYRAIETVAGRTSIMSAVTFEGCARSKRFADAGYGSGPHGMIAIVSATTGLTVLWRGRELGHLDNASLVAFGR